MRKYLVVNQLDGNSPGFLIETDPAWFDPYIGVYRPIIRPIIRLLVQPQKSLVDSWYICQLSFPICGYQRIVAVPEIDEGKKVHGLAMFSPKFCGL